MLIFNSFINLLFPNLCVACNENLVKGEHFVCLKCLNEIPKTNFHLQKENSVEQRFWGKVPIEKATSYFFFQKGSKFQHLLHELKYKNNKEIGEFLGKYSASELINHSFLQNIDLIVPVPLHPKREAKRGYNQSEWICKGISELTQKPMSARNLIRNRENTTQTKKSVFERYENTQGIFEVKNPAEFAEKHILLVDDVLTTGSTIEACMQELQKVENVKISVFTLAVAQ